METSSKMLSKSNQILLLIVMIVNFTPAILVAVSGKADMTQIGVFFGQATGRILGAAILAFLIAVIAWFCTKKTNR